MTTTANTSPSASAAPEKAKVGGRNCILNYPLPFVSFERLSARTPEFPRTNTGLLLILQVDSFEVGWLFVQEYYTFLNREPSKLHCFYNKKSCFSHGHEGENNVKLCHGQAEIHNRIIELDFQDCKVLVSNVDSQASLNGGIIVQVLGEMSNKSGASHKFAQTFFLAEQPNGYYVLNDIFRFLKEDIDNEYDEAEDPTGDSFIPHEVIRAASPAARAPSPAPRAASPAPRPASPAPRAASPAPRPASPIVAPVSPAARATSPLRGASPVREPVPA
ncbi:hypothetical protein BDK51DRAFT_18648, partial [Blyttiomyces helicus]